MHKDDAFTDGSDSEQLSTDLLKENLLEDPWPLQGVIAQGIKFRDLKCCESKVWSKHNDCYSKTERQRST